MIEIELDDAHLDKHLLSLQGISIVVFYRPDCANCKQAREKLPEFNLDVDQLIWLDVNHAQGAAKRYEVFHLPAMFAIKNGVFYGEIHAYLEQIDIGRQLNLALSSAPALLP